MYLNYLLFIAVIYYLLFIWILLPVVYVVGYHQWYKVIERVLPGQSLAQVLKKTLVDQTIAAPLIITTFFLVMGYLDSVERGDANHVQGACEKWRANFVEAMQMNYVIWPAAAFVNYKFVPIQHRIAYISVISLFWGTILSLINSAPREKHATHE
jgi:protein Mpv17